MSCATSKGNRRGLICIVVIVIGLLLLLVSLVYFVFVLPFWGIPFSHSRHTRVPLTPPWALECWLWEDDVNTGAYVRELLEGYQKHDLPVRTLLIDSPWSMRYNDFRVDESRYPEPERFCRDLQDRGYRVVLWMTCMVNSRSRDTQIAQSQAFYDEARTNGFLAGQRYKWWKGEGGFVDYTNPKAMHWWHGLQSQVLDWGVDGWKLDGCDTLFSTRVGGLRLPFGRTKSGWLTTRQYMDLYARNEYRNGLQKNPEFVTLIRSMDHSWVHPEGFSPLDAAPVTWVGDNQHTWNYEQRGLEAAITDILAASQLGYGVIGSDIGGYHGRSNPDDITPETAALLSAWKSGRDGANMSKTVAPAAGTQADEIAPNVYIRWAQFSSFCGLFLNGGHGERRLWKRTEAELDIIRKFAWLHTELVPYMYSHLVQCHRGGKPLMRPLARGRYHYLFGDDFLVAPIYEDKLQRTVSLPSGQWRYFFKDDELANGPAQFTREFPLDEFPVYIRAGAIVPLSVARGYTGFGDSTSAPFRTWLIYPSGNSEFTLWKPETHPKPESVTVRVEASTSWRIVFKGAHEPHILLVFTHQKPKRVELDTEELEENQAWTYQAGKNRLVITTRAYKVGEYKIIWR